MQFTWYEMKKALTSPIVIVLLGLFVAFNGFQIISQSYDKEELKIVNNIVSTYGSAITDETLQEMEKSIQGNMKQLGIEQDTESYLEEMNAEKYAQMDTSQQNAVDQIGLNYLYYTLGMELESRYQGIDMQQLRSEMLSTLPEQGWLLSLMEEQFTNWEQRYTEIVRTEEYKAWFFAGEYRMHSELFRSLLKNIAIQSVMLAVLITALIANYEVEQRTQSTIYTTKKGRSLIWHKLSAALAGSFLSFSVLTGASLGIFFMTYDYSNIWQTPISSGLNWEYKLPYITWWPINVWQYLLLAILIELAVVLIIAILAFVMSLYVKNSYFTWILCIAGLIAIFILPSFLNGAPSLQFISSLNITMLLMNPHMYFTGGTTFNMIQHVELWTLSLWGLMSLLCCSWGIRRFLMKDVA